MEGVPKSIDLSDIIKTMKDISGVLSIHDLHVWSITSGQNSLSCHVVVDGDLSVRDSQKLLRLIEHELEHKDVTHITIQLENKEHQHRNSLICQSNPNSSPNIDQ